MAVQTAQSKEARRAPLPLTNRRDNWWIKPLTTVLVLSGFVIYTAWRGLENQFYEVGPYLSPFYSPLLPIHWTLFGWNISPFEGSPEPYLSIKNGDANNGGIREVRPGEPPHWLVYIATEDIDAGLAKVEELGGTKIAGPIDIQVAKIGIVQDPQGAVFALYAGDLEP